MHTAKAESQNCRLLILGVANRTANQSNTNNFISSFLLRHFVSSVPRTAEDLSHSYRGGRPLPAVTLIVQVHRRLPEPRLIRWHYLVILSKYRVRQLLRAPLAHHLRR